MIEECCTLGHTYTRAQYLNSVEIKQKNKTHNSNQMGNIFLSLSNFVSFQEWEELRIPASNPNGNLNFNEQKIARQNLRACLNSKFYYTHKRQTEKKSEYENFFGSHQKMIWNEPITRCMPKCCATELISLIVITRIFDDLFFSASSLCALRISAPACSVQCAHRLNLSHHYIAQINGNCCCFFVSFIILAPNNLSKNNSNSDAMRKHCRNYGQTMGIIGWTHFDHSYVIWLLLATEFRQINLNLTAQESRESSGTRLDSKNGWMWYEDVTLRIARCAKSETNAIKQIAMQLSCGWMLDAGNNKQTRNWKCASHFL